MKTLAVNLTSELLNFQKKVKLPLEIFNYKFGNKKCNFSKYTNTILFIFIWNVHNLYYIKFNNGIQLVSICKKLLNNINWCKYQERMLATVQTNHV